MAVIRGKLSRKQLPTGGRDGEILQIDSRTASGLAWIRPGIDVASPSSGSDGASVSYVDGEVTSARGYTDTEITSARGYTDTQITAARAYTDSEIDDLPVHSAGLAGTILSSGVSVQAFTANHWFPCPVGGTHTLVSDSSSVFTRPANQSVFRYTGTPTIIAHILATGVCQRTTAGVAWPFFVGVGKGTSVPANADIIAGTLLFMTGEYGLWSSYAVNMILELDQNDYVAPLFNSYLSSLVPHSFSLGYSQVTIRQLREA